MKYKEAIKKLEEIVEKMEKGELDIDQMAEQLKEAQKLVKMCQERLTKVDEDVKKILS